MTVLHASCVAFDNTALLLRGPSGSGKSDLALRLIDAGAALLADDYVELEVRDGELWAQAPAAIKGKIEGRGVGILSVTAIETARVGAVIDLVDLASIERLPEPSFCELQGIAIPHHLLYPFEASAVVKVKAILGYL